MSHLTDLDKKAFEARARAVMQAMGMEGAKPYRADGLDCAYRQTIVRESSDGLFRSEEPWLVAFRQSSEPLAQAQVEQIRAGVLVADVRYLLLVTLGELPELLEASLREALEGEQIRVALLHGALAERFIEDRRTLWREGVEQPDIALTAIVQQVRELLRDPH